MVFTADLAESVTINTSRKENDVTINTSREENDIYNLVLSVIIFI
jgi:hypothetical protein